LKETVDRLDFKKVVGYLVGLMKRKYHGRVILSYYNGKITKLRLEESLDMAEFEKEEQNAQ
jgi:hypothetical protein